MKRMGGLRKWMPITSATFIVAWLAIAGVPPFAGFWSKDDILANAWDKSPILWLVGVVTAGLTAYYMSRQVFLVFFGDERWRTAAPEPTEAAAEPGHEPAAAGGKDMDAVSAGDASHGGHREFKPHESPATMTFPLVVLAALAAVGGLLSLPFGSFHPLETWLEPVFGDRLHELSLSGSSQLAYALGTVVLALVGIAIAYLIYLGHKVREESVEPTVLCRAWYIDPLYAAVIERPGRMLSNWLAYFLDAKVVDGAVNGVAALVRGGGSRLRAVQSGYVRNYALAVASGAVLIVGYVLVRGGA